MRRSVKNDDGKDLVVVAIEDGEYLELSVLDKSDVGEEGKHVDKCLEPERDDMICVWTRIGV